MGVGQLSIEDLYVEVRQLRQGVTHLLLEELCDGVRQLPMDGCYSWELDNSQLMNEFSRN